MNSFLLECPNCGVMADHWMDRVDCLVKGEVKCVRTCSECGKHSRWVSEYLTERPIRCLGAGMEEPVLESVDEAKFRMMSERSKAAHAKRVASSGRLGPRIGKDAKAGMEYLKDAGRIFESTEGNPDCCCDGLYDAMVGAHAEARRASGYRIPVSSGGVIDGLRMRDDLSWFWDSRRVGRKGGFWGQWHRYRRRLNDVRRVSERV